ncbi:VanZ family protein [Ammoniphilus sp. CFH 90114]|uniref:VanZ family protein n=1 Tax=Ammoniphilus sp. CFH 90114 TaxID=2493665 RepID=UPI00100FC0C5|nr:VanZ family protein [Ammoniphilus sp. CFH 90114]RXT02868.1 hypothetical protein EIZ39_24060 [Ammoniphilus sp. CFH 90114]
MAILITRGEFYAMIGIDKIYHFFFYGTMACILGSIACKLSPRSQSLPRLFGIALILLFMGVLDEYRQFFDRHRDTEFLDAVANLLGIAAGLSVPAVISLSHFRKNTKLNWKAMTLAVLVLVPLFYSLTYFTSKPPPTPFFSQGTTQAGGISVKVGSIVSSPQRIAYQSLQEKYVPQLLYIEKEYTREMRELITYSFEREHALYHLWLMYKLEGAVDAQFDQIQLAMKRSAQQSGLNPSLTNQVRQEFMLRKKAQRAKLLKQAILDQRAG